MSEDTVRRVIGAIFVLVIIAPVVGAALYRWWKQK